jgi:hypothetical protein
MGEVREKRRVWGRTVDVDDDLECWVLGGGN